MTAEALLGAGVADDVLCELAEVHTAREVAGDDLNDPLLPCELPIELDLHHMAGMNVTYRLNVLGLDIVEDSDSSRLLVPSKAFDLVEDHLSLGVPSRHGQQVRSLHSLDINAVNGILFDILYREGLQLLLVPIVE